jgi:hypothetical protein
MKYYVYDNASRRIKSSGFTYAFDITEQFGGSWRGVMTLSDPAAIAELEKFAARMGIREISETEYNELLKKKLNSKQHLQNTHPQQNQQIKAGAGPVVIREPSARTTPDVKTVTGTVSTKPTVEEVVVLGDAPYVDPLEQRSKKRGKRGSAS